MANEKLFGRVYEGGVGSTEKDLLLKTRGDIKIQIGKRFVSLLKNGELNIPNTFKEVDSTDSIKSDGLYLVGESVYAKINGKLFPFSANESQDKINYETVESALENVTNGIVFVGNTIYKIENGQATEYTTTKDLLELAKVAYSGNYEDLNNLPTIPVNTSELTNDSDFLTSQEADSRIDGLSDTINGEIARAQAAEGLLAGDITALLTAMQSKVDLSSLSNYYTKTEVDGLIPDAQILSDWNLTTTTAKDYIKNKPSIPTNTSDLNNDSGFLTQHLDISGKANTSDLATVATTGNYSDIIGAPLYVICTLQEYNAMASHDSNTYYIILGNE